jgi:hypothetical protein
MSKRNTTKKHRALLGYLSPSPPLMQPDQPTFISKKDSPAPKKLPHLRIDCAKPKHELRLDSGARSLIRASLGAA